MNRLDKCMHAMYNIELASFAGVKLLKLYGDFNESTVERGKIMIWSMLFRFSGLIRWPLKFYVVLLRTFVVVVFPEFRSEKIDFLSKHQMKL